MFKSFSFTNGSQIGLPLHGQHFDFQSILAQPDAEELKVNSRNWITH
jgi:hypothetical protein